MTNKTGNAKTKLIWDDKYSVGVAMIDEQHKEFLNIIESLRDLKNRESFSDEEALVKVAQLSDYASYHFSTEEGILRTTGYEGLDEHIEAHNVFRKKAKDSVKEIRDKSKNKKEVIKGILDFTEKWLINHILKIDKKYTAFLEEKRYLLF